MAQNYLTRAGYQKLQKDLGDLKKRKETLSLEIADAREKGDLRENGEYIAAKERLGEIMSRIGKVEEQLSSARLIDEIAIRKDEVQIGVRVTLLDKADGEECTWTLVGEAESDPTAGRMSVNAPLAQGILGHKVGEDVQVHLPAGSRTFQIVRTEPAL